MAAAACAAPVTTRAPSRRSPPTIAVVVPSFDAGLDAHGRQRLAVKHPDPATGRRAFALDALALSAPAARTLLGLLRRRRLAVGLERRGVGPEAERRVRHPQHVVGAGNLIATFAVMPGFSFSSGFGTSITVT